MARTPRARVVYIATTKEHARELIWEKLKHVLFKCGIEAKFNETRMTAELKRNGARVRLYGADDNKEIDKLRGMSFHEVIIDEAASHDLKLLEKLIKRVAGPRMGEFRGCIVLLGTPGHDLRGIFYEATKPGHRDRAGVPTNRNYADRDKPEYDLSHPDSKPYRSALDPETGAWLRWSVHHWEITDALHIPALANEYREHLLEKESEGWSDENPIWLREYRGIWAADDTEMMFKYRAQKDGADWNQWDPPRDRRGFAILPKGPDGKERTDWHYAYGFDMGHSDPFAVVVWAFSPSDTTRTLYHVYSFEKPKMYARLIAQLLLGADEKAPNGCCPHEKPEGVFKSTGWPVGLVSDMTHLGPAVLDELQNVYGIKILPAEQKAKNAAIELFNGDLIDGRIKILKGSVLEEQLASLQWQPDEFGRLREPKGVANHSADAAVYGRRLIAHLFDSGTIDTGPKRSAFTPSEAPPTVFDDPEIADADMPEPDWGDLYR